jgi:peptide/nickel transport system substrate-binding protein
MLRTYSSRAASRASRTIGRALHGRRALALTALAGTVAVLGGCGGSSSPSSSSGSGTGGHLIVAIDSGVTSLDPARACTAFYDYMIVKNLYDPLVDYGSNMVAGGKREIVPALASSWTVSPDKRTYTFHLRPGVTFSSGNPLTAEDVVYSLKRTIASEGCQAYVLTFNNKFTEIKALNPSTVRVTTAVPDPLLLDQFAQTGTGPLDKKELEAHGGLSSTGDNWIATHSAGTGAYVLSSDQPNNEVVLTARKNYWAGTPKNSGLDIRVITDPATLSTLARSGEADMVYGIPLKEVSAMQGAGRKVISEPFPFYSYLGLNNKVAPLNNPLVRKAIDDTLPLRSIASALGYGQVHTYVGPIPPAMPFFANLPVPEPNVAQAKALMKQAGVKSANVTVDVIQGKQEEQEIATVVQSALKPIGINVTINTIGSSAFFSAVEGFKEQAYLLLDGSPLNDPAYLLGYIVACGNTFNWPQYCNPKIQPLLPKAALATEPNVRKELYRQISQYFVEDPGYVPIFSPNEIIIADPNLSGYVQYPDGETVFWPISK